MSLYERVLGHPFVYDYVRPLAVGGIDMSPFYRRLHTDQSSVVLDIGCGTGDALRYLGAYDRYVGVDTDPVAIGFAESRYGSDHRVSFQSGNLTAERVERVDPTHAVLAGLLHHLTDQEALELLGFVAAAPRLRQVVTSDVAYLSGKPVSNLLARMDRGRYSRRPHEYEQLASEAGLAVRDSDVMRCHPRTGLAWYFVMTLEPRPR